MKRTMTTLVAAGAAASAAVLGAAYSGLVNVGADDPHFPAVHAFLVMARERSIEVRARDIEVPNLKDEALIRTGAGNYNAMCVGCHLAPGVDQTELSQALYPPPPNLTNIGAGDNPAVAFWTIKHGIKATGMPAWGKSMGDQYIWGIVAFLDQLPQMDAQQYQAMVANSGGHQHGGGESAMHSAADQHGGHHGHGAEQSKAHHPTPDSAKSGHHDGHGEGGTGDGHPATSTPKTHVHRDGKEHTHAN
ncbi:MULTISPECIES: c-type cytochrome [Pseudomonas]|uniref:c-type cytochrome n=1 Tax=Pseudomonas TaxID=286 RepID=UPI0018AAB6B8|nr:cytochrome c [Pseudomonas guariconensis]MBF8730331.1 cytochrome c [Pseudomonas guariconensis]